MKKFTLLLSFFACVLASQAQTLVNENFDYAAGTGLIGQGSWAIVGTSVVNPITVSAASISYPNYPSSGVGQELSIATNGQDVTKAFTAQLTGTVYYSFIANFSTAKTTGDYFIHTVETGSTSAFFGRVYVKSVGEKIAFGILSATGGTYSPTYTDAIYDLNSTYLIVVKVDASTGASSLIINPAFTPEPTSWINNTTGGTTVPSATAGIGGINIRQGTDANAPTLKLDGIRVATTWNALFTSTGLKTASTDKLNVSVAGKTLTITNAPSNTVEIFNMIGAKVQKVELKNNSVDLNLAKGVYLIRAGKATAKIML
jgi:hypothetical protein